MESGGGDVELESKIKELKRVIGEVVNPPNIEDIEYVDFKGYLEDLQIKRNYFVFGRRGAGKTVLLSQLDKILEKDKIPYSYENVAKYKDLKYPDTLIEVLIKILNDCKPYVKSRNPFNYFKIKKLKAKIDSHIEKFEGLLESQDGQEVHRELEAKEEETAQTDAGVSLQVGKAGHEQSKISSKVSKESFQQTINKNEFLTLKISEIQSILQQIIDISGKKKGFILLDDFSDLRMDDQTKIIDYMFLLTRTIEFFVKIGTIPHRTLLYERKKNGKPVGMQSLHDYGVIDLDYKLEFFDETRDFLSQILMAISRKIDFNNVMDVFVRKDNVGFDTLIWASGGGFRATF